MSFFGQFPTRIQQLNGFPVRGTTANKGAAPWRPFTRRGIRIMERCMTTFNGTVRDLPETNLQDWHHTGEDSKGYPFLYRLVNMASLGRNKVTTDIDSWHFPTQRIFWKLKPLFWLIIVVFFFWKIMVVLFGKLWLYF